MTEPSKQIRVSREIVDELDKLKRDTLYNTYSGVINLLLQRYHSVIQLDDTLELLETLSGRNWLFTQKLEGMYKKYITEK